MFRHKLDGAGVYKLDSAGVYDSITALPRQIAVLWERASTLKLRRGCRLVDNVVVVGMGGSALGARVVKGMCSDRLSLPLELVTGYHLPAYVNERSLVVLSSHSGGTEEVLRAGDEAIQKKACVVVVTCGGELGALAEEHGWGFLRLDDSFNPSKQPRMAIGMSVMALLAILVRCGHLQVDNESVGQVVVDLQAQQKILAKDTLFKANPAKRLAAMLEKKAAVMIAAGHLTGAVHVFKNQLNENAKTFAVEFDLPELNHHLLEGLGFPRELKQVIHFVLFESELYDSELCRRLVLTEEVLLKQGYPVTRIKAESDGVLGQVWETIAFGEYVSFYLAMLHNLDPAPIPWVDYFKSALKN